jgi:hypothetical protein
VSKSVSNLYNTHIHITTHTDRCIVCVHACLPSSPPPPTEGVSLLSPPFPLPFLRPWLDMEGVRKICITASVCVCVHICMCVFETDWREDREEEER